MTTLPDAIPAAAAGLEVLGMVTALVALAWAADRAVAGRRAAWRCAIWSVALVAVGLTPALTAVGRLLPWHTPVLPPAAGPTSPAPGDPPVLTVGSDADYQPAGPATAVPRPAVVAAAPVAPSSAQDAPTPPAADPPGNLLEAAAAAFLAVWAAGSCYLAARLVYGGVRVRRLRRRAVPLAGERWAGEVAAVARTLAVPRLPRVCVSADVAGPVVAGLFRPRVVLPVGLPGRCDARHLRAVLVHEYAHVVRRDP